MRLALLPAFVLATAALGWSGLHTHASFASTISGTTANHSALFSVAAQAATTATLTTAATPAATTPATPAATSAVTSTTVPQNTPVPLPTATSGGSLQLNPLNWNYLTSAAPDGLGAFGPFSWLYLLLMLVLFGAGAYFYFYKRPQWKRTNTVYRRAAERFAPPAMWLSGITILFMIFRVVHLDGLNLRFWLYLSLLSLIGLGVWFYYWYTRSRPGELAKFEKTQRARQYMPTAKKGSARPATAPKTSSTTQSATVVPTSAASGQAATRPATSTAKRKKRR